MESRLCLSTIARVREFARRPPRRITLGDLFRYQGRIGSEVRPSDLVQLAGIMRQEMPLRFATQLMEYYRLPYLVWMSEPFVTVHDLHLKAFEELSNFREISNDKDVYDFTNVLRFHVQDTDSIGAFRSGLDELQSHGFGANELQQLHPFLDKFIVTRIGNQVLANHFLDWFDKQRYSGASESVITECYLAPLLMQPVTQVCNLASRIYGVRPVVTIDDSLDTRVLVVPAHVQFIFREILKNAVHATMETSKDREAAPVQVSIRPGEYDVELRISDQGGGMNQKMLGRIWQYGFSGSPWPPTEAGIASATRLRLQMSGYGMGIPLSRHYATFFGGDLHFSSVYGFGTDVSVRLNRLPSVAERQAAEMDSVSDPGSQGKRPPLPPSIFDFEVGGVAG